MSSIFVQLSTVSVVLISFLLLSVSRPAAAGTWLSFTQGDNQPSAGDIEQKLVPSLPTGGDMSELMKACSTLYREAIRKRITTATLLKRDGSNANLVLCQRLFQLINKK